MLAAAHLLSPKGTAQITLTKNLPVAAGIGGGTADAAAAYRGLSKLWALPAPDASEQTFTRVAQLGSDVPVCLFSRAARMSGVGEKIELLPHLPELHAVLVNPRVEVQTPQVFNAVTDKNNAPMDVLPKSLPDGSSLIDWISHQRNDMQSAAISIAPVISEVLAAIDATPACQLARMSGSGATCFGLFPDSEAAWAAEAHILNSRPEWWVRSCTLGDQSAN
ncbi:4-diphosphocytidyl-2-C-methyl-D-erythritol kinase [Litoreibacter arenae DSM 19593]|uniref:4-diphosphocytidyl-2-C-methyl-D-erythritol kinase n=1 Tax=Litoreibacter arenae DSM 19593 TaxID=1123360 RepID=S9RSQ3_9RHOB|nr:4-diphosphocytidyl-2-C-methyl-D-erythritol kinase [Litoreibacter arenae DSM 19593]